MADKELGALSPIEALLAAALFHTVQQGNSRKVTAQQIADFVNGNYPAFIQTLLSAQSAEDVYEAIGAAPEAENADRLGGHLPAFFASAQDVATAFEQLTKADVDLGNVDNTSDDDKPISTEQQAALDLKVTGPNGGVSAKQVAGFADTTGDSIIGLTPEELRVFAQVMKGGYSGRDYLMNGNFRRWQRGTSQTTGGYGSHDRWFNNYSSSTMSSDRRSFAPGQTEVPGFPRFYTRTNWTPGPDNAASYAVKCQVLWDVTKIAGKRLTLTFWARASYARPLPLEFFQQFGTGGTPSTANSFLAGTANVGTEWQRFSLTFVVPSLAGKVLGSDDNSSTEFLFWLDGGTNFSARHGALPRMPQGWIELAMVSLVDGDATGEVLPVEWYDPDVENKRMDAFCQQVVVNLRAYAYGAGNTICGPLQWSEMRRSPDVSLVDAGISTNIAAFAMYNVTRWGCRPELIANAAGDFYMIGRQYILSAD